MIANGSIAGLAEDSDVGAKACVKDKLGSAIKPKNVCLAVCLAKRAVFYIVLVRLASDPEGVGRKADRSDIQRQSLAQQRQCWRDGSASG